MNTTTTDIIDYTAILNGMLGITTELPIFYTASLLCFLVSFILRQGFDARLKKKLHKATK